MTITICGLVFLRLVRYLLGTQQPFIKISCVHGFLSSTVREVVIIVRDYRKG